MTSILYTENDAVEAVKKWALANGYETIAFRATELVGVVLEAIEDEVLGHWCTIGELEDQVSELHHEAGTAQ